MTDIEQPKHIVDYGEEIFEAWKDVITTQQEYKSALLRFWDDIFTEVEFDELMEDVDVNPEVVPQARAERRRDAAFARLFELIRAPVLNELETIHEKLVAGTMHWLKLEEKYITSQNLREAIDRGNKK